MALAASTLLDQVETAITALHSGQHSSYSIGARSVSRLDLKALYEERRLLKDAVAAESGTKIRVAKMVRPGT